MSRPERASLAALLLAALSIAGVVRLAVAEPPSEDEILRQIKSDVFEERWDSVLADTERLIATYPDSAQMPRTMYYRAKALQHIEGREDETLRAWGEFIEKYPGETLLREDAQIQRFGLAKSLWLKGNKGAISILMQGLEEKGYPRLYAAIQISHLDHRPARARALPILQDCSKNEKDAELRNECTIAILRIDPSAVPVPQAAQAPAQPQNGEPKLIRLEVREKATGKVTVAVNLPIAFAEVLLSSLSEIEQGRVMEELKRRKIDLDNIWKSLKTMGRQTLLQIETEELNIRIWLE